jgi:hypothetical protein
MNRTEPNLWIPHFLVEKKIEEKKLDRWKKMSGGWERVRGSRSRPTRDSSSGLRMPSRNVTLGRVQPQAPGHRTIYCNDRDANLPVRFKVCLAFSLFIHQNIYIMSCLT